MAANQTVLDPYYIKVDRVTMDVMCSFIGLVFFLGISGNTVVVLVHRKIKEKSATDWMIFYIAICDIMALLNLPLYVSQMEGYWAQYRFPKALCKVHFLNFNSVAMASYLFTACTALERYCKVVLSKEVFSPVRAKWMSIPVFIVSYGTGTLSALAVTNNPNGHCGFDREVTHFNNLSYGSLLFVAFSSSLVMAICYIRTGVFLVSKMKEITQSGNNESFMRSYRNMIQTTKMLAVVTIVFLISANAPYFVGFVVSFTVQPTREPWLSIVFVLSVMFVVNNFSNPFLYMGMSTSFRQRSMAIFHSCCRNKYEASKESSKSTQGTTIPAITSSEHS